MSQTKLIDLDCLTQYDAKIKELIDSESGNTTYTLSAGTGADAEKIVLTDSNGNEDKVTVPYANNAGTVNSHTVEKDVPADAKFTDTTYSDATTSASGLMSATDKEKVNGLGTASTKNVAASGNASNSEVVMGNDTRLSDSRPASDVYSWAKASSKPGYSKSEVGLGNVANIDQSKAIKSITRSGTTFTATALDNSTFTFTQQDNNTTYSANNGVGLSGTTFYNSGVRSIGTGTANGTISVNTNGTAANVSVKGLGTAAYTNSTAYAAASHTHSYLPLSGGTMTGDVNMGVKSINNAYRVTSQGYISGLSSGDVYLMGNGNVNCVNAANNAFRPVYASAFTVASSKNIKENIHPMTDIEAKKLLDVNIVSFDYKKEVGGEKNNYGVIAEELNEIIPYACNMKDESKEDSMSNISSVDYSKLVPYLVKMIQIQQQEINELKNK